LAATLLAVMAGEARAQQQRVRFPTAVNDPGSPFYNPQSPAAALRPTIQPVATGAPPSDPYGDPANQAPSLPTYGQSAAPAYTAGPLGAPPAAGYGAPGAPAYAPAPSPFAGVGQGPFNQPVGQPPVLANGMAAPRQRLLQEIHFDETQLLRIGNHGLGITDVGLDAAFALPVFSNPNPLFITPGFTYSSWNGPSSGNFAGSPDLPPNAYAAYLDASWHPQITSWLSADLDARVGVYSDFGALNGFSIRELGRGLGIVTFSPQWQVAAGVWYLDRLTVKILPAGGVIWTPNQDTRFDLLFPNPKLSRRLFTLGNTDVWGYLAGEYGGGRWTIRRANGASDVVQLDDLRALAGFEFFTFGGIRGNGEIGYVFDRHIIYRSGTAWAHPGDTVLFRGGLTY
jgi:hypothetical protein